MSIETVKQRKALKVRREPYWRAIGTGQHVGFRQAEDGGHWVARAYDAATRKRQYRALGDLSQFTDAERYTVAVKLAMAFFDHVAKGGHRDEITVLEAWQRYAEHQRQRKGEAAAADVLARMARNVKGDPIAGVPLTKLQPRHLKEWAGRLAGKPATPAKRGPRCRVQTPQPEAKQKAPATLNRDLVPMRAALNLALADNYATSDAAWRQALRPTSGADRRRTLYLSKDQRRALIEALPADAAAFVRGLSLLPLRPGALAALTVADFHAKQGALRIGSDKAGAQRVIPLPDAVVTLLKAQARDKLPSAPLFARWDGSAWSKDAWKGPLKTAALAAGLPAETTAYTLRHSTITDLTTAGLDLFSVAALAGTSVAMIEKHYGHLQADRARAALAGLAL